MRSGSTVGETEARLLASLNHRSLVTLFDAIVTQDATYLVMELMEGGTLGARIHQRAGRDSSENRVTIAEAVAGALEHIHARADRHDHRDVKPANVLLAGPTTPVDGQALPTSASPSCFETAPRSVGRGDRRCAVYLSPEQARGEQVTTASDATPRSHAARGADRCYRSSPARPS